MKSNSSSENKIGLLNLLVVILSLYVLIAIVFDTFFDLSEETTILLNYIDNIICVFFMIEFTYRFFRAENKLKFMRWGWIDLLASIPMIGILRAGRVLRLIRLLRVIRAFKSTQNFVNHVFSNKIEGTFTSISVLSVLLVIFSAIAILQVENDPNSNIKTAEDAIWWAYVTITTVGYGDKFPVTTEGRVIAAFLMTAGVGLFGTFTAFVASWFVKEDNKESN
jgi:voltage-gated potassium channel